MPADQLKRMVYRQDQVLQMPFPSHPSLAREIESGILKMQGAARYDEAMKRYAEAVQNILKLSLRWPKLEEWQSQVQSVLDAVANIASLQASTAAIQISITTLNSASTSQQISITSILNSIANLTAAINNPAVVPTLEKQFLVPASSWPWNHGLGFRPMVEVYDSNWIKMLAYTDNTDDNNLTVRHTYNATGWLVIR